MNRRKFFAMVVGASLAGKVGLSSAPTVVLYTGGLQRYIDANRWPPPPPPTEEEFIRFLEHALSLPIPPQNVLVSPDFRRLLEEYSNARR